MKKQFENYLIVCGYKQLTDAGEPSTVYSYLKSIEKVLAWEKITWNELANKISYYCELYDIGGLNEKKGAMSHSTVINALKQLKLFVENN